MKTLRRGTGRSGERSAGRSREFGARFRRAGIAIRIARRSSLRAPGRSALIVALITLPVAGMAALTLVIASTVATTAERIAVELGHSQARVQVIGPPNSGLTQDPLATGWGGGSVAAPGEPALPKPGDLFPTGTSLIPVLDTAVTVKTLTGVAVLPALEGRPWDRGLAGRYDVVAGRVPAAAGEVMATASTLHRLGIALGQEARLVAPVQQTVTVVGLLDDRMKPAATDELFGLPGAFTGQSDLLNNSSTTLYLPDTVLDWKQVQQLNKQGAVVLSRQVLEHPPALGSSSMSRGSSLAFAFMYGAMIFGFALLEVTLLAGAAFTVGTRAQERSLAIVASAGSSRSTIFSIITANGLVLGLIGGVIGVGLGIGAGSAFMHLTGDGSATRYWGYHLWWPAMIGIALFALVIGWLGALVPAVRGSKFDVVAALRGARRPAAPRRRRPIAGVVAVMTGVALTLVGGSVVIVQTQTYSTSPLIGVAIGLLIGGPILAQLGLVLCSGLLLRLLARLFSRAGVAARLASRDAARNPGRSVPALAVIMTTVFVAVFAMTLITSFEVTARTNYDYSTMPGQVQIPLQYLSSQRNAVTAFPQADRVVSAMDRALEISSARALASVPDAPLQGRAGTSPGVAPPDVLLPELVVPPANQCPSEPTSVNFSRATTIPGSAEQRKARSDWRCQNSYVLYGQGGDGGGHIWVGTAADLALVLGAAPSQAAKDTLAGGGAVSLYPEYLASGKATISWWPASNWTQPHSPFDHPAAVKSRSIPAVLQQPAHPIRFGIFISPATARTLGLPYAISTVLAATKTMPTTAQLDALNSAVDVLAGSPTAHYFIRVERGPAQTAGAFSWAIVGLAALIAIGAAAVAIGLARADGRRDQETLAAVGGGSRVTRGFGFWQALVLAGTGAVLGAAVGLVPAVALTLPGSSTMFSAPWPTIVGAATMMPLAIACGAWLLAAGPAPRPRRSAIQ